MALVLANRVQESGTANTTVSFTLTGAIAGFQSFAVIGNGNTTYYSATDGSGNWEVGLGTYSTTGPTLDRTTVYASSNTGSAVTFSGPVNVFVTYPSGKSVNLDASGNVSPLGTVASGTWQGSTVGVAYGGTGVTASSGANSVVLRDADQNIVVNSVTQAVEKTVSSGGTKTLTTASPHFQILTGTTTHTYKLPDATLLPPGSTWVFDNDSTQNLTVTDYAGSTVDVVAPGGYSTVFLETNGTVAGEWGRFGMLPNEVNWGTNSLDLGGSTVVTNGVWQGTAVAPGYGGTGLTTFVGANNALYSTGASTLTAGTLPVAAGGTGLTATPTNGQLDIGNGTGFTRTTLTQGSGISITNGVGSISIAATNAAGITYVTKTANYTAANNEGVLANTAGGAFTVTLPATPQAGWQVIVADDGGSWGTNNLTVGRNGSTINGAASDLVCDISGVSVQLVYDGSTWNVYAQIGGNGGTAVTLDGVQTLTNKTLGSGTVLGAAVTGGDFGLTRTFFQDTGWVYYNSGTTNALDYVNGSVQRWAPNTGSQTLTIANWPPSGNLGELLIEGVNLGAATITWPTINWITSTGATTTTFANNGVTLQTSGTDWVYLWTRDAGTTIYGKVVR